MNIKEISEEIANMLLGDSEKNNNLKIDIEIPNMEKYTKVHNLLSNKIKLIIKKEEIKKWI